MTRASEITIDGRDLLSSVRIGVRMPCLFGLRTWAAARLFKIAGWVSGTSVVIEVETSIRPSEM